MIKIIITSIILFIIFIIILLSLNVKIEYFNSGSLEPVISGDYITDYIDTDNIYYMFRSGTSTFSIPTSLICDILVVGGGGGGGYDAGGGGGGGQVLYYTNDSVPFKTGNSVILNSGTYTIIVGNGGNGGLGQSSNGTNGQNSTIVDTTTSTTIFNAKGGGAGGSRNNQGHGGDVGGGGGTGHANASDGGTSLNGGGIGGTNGSGPIRIPHNIGGGGGGGGANISDNLKNGEKSQSNRAGNGGSGVDISITGTSVGYGGGGAGGSFAYIGGTATHGGGRGNATNAYGIASPGIRNTGGGGGSGGHIAGNPIGASGGSGVVIIKINKKNNSYIDNSTDCPVNYTPSGEIKQVPDTNMNISVISKITKLNDNLYNQAFGNGNITYTITFSKYFNDDYVPTNLFLRNNKLAAFAINNYNNGIYNTNINTGLNSYSEKGDFIHIRLPSNITLKRYGFRADKSAVTRAPGSWALYTGLRLLEPTPNKKDLLVSNLIRIDNNNYCQKNQYTYIHDIQTNNISGNELLFIFPSLAGSANVLSFMELILYT